MNEKPKLPSPLPPTPPFPPSDLLSKPLQSTQTPVSHPSPAPETLPVLSIVHLEIWHWLFPLPTCVTHRERHADSQAHEQ
eukprot:747534-Hanusia_phi.AAC.5